MLADKVESPEAAFFRMLKFRAGSLHDQILFHVDYYAAPLFELFLYVLAYGVNLDTVLRLDSIMGTSHRIKVHELVFLVLYYDDSEYFTTVDFIADRNHYSIVYLKYTRALVSKRSSILFNTSILNLFRLLVISKIVVETSLE